MEPMFSFYTPADFGRVYHFLRAHRSHDNWPYERVRFQFCLALHPALRGVYGGHERTCGLWQDENGIVSLVLTEGGTCWEETFFAFRSEQDRTDSLLHRMCSFAERFTSRVSEDRTSSRYQLCVADGDERLAALLAQRGYQRTENHSRVMVKPYPAQPEEVVLPQGFVIRDARTVPAFYYALAHSHSFRYNQDDNGGLAGFEAIRTMPDYRPELDLIVLDEEGQPAGLANFWVSEKSPTASMEPLGTVWWQRRMGLGKALITEGINRTRAYGCTALVGGDQPFYWSLGFAPQATYTNWAWSSDANG